MPDTAQIKAHSIFAPAKINLYLHVTGHRDNGYHTLDSLISFVDIGDELRISPAETLTFEAHGPFAGHFQAHDLDTGPNASNLVVQAVHALCRLTGQTPNIKVTLTKNLPLGAGLGGGSSDAAALLWQLLEYCDIPNDLEGLHEAMLSLGADVPVCFKAQTTRIQGIGEILEPAPTLPEIPVVLIYPAQPCNTARIFADFEGGFRDPITLPEQLGTLNALNTFLKQTHNDLAPYAEKTAPEINNALNALNTREGCSLARMSGSGSACFGLFENDEDAQRAAQDIAQGNPDWWVQSGWLGRPERY